MYATAIAAFQTILYLLEDDINSGQSSDQDIARTRFDINYKLNYTYCMHLSRRQIILWYVVTYPR